MRFVIMWMVWLGMSARGFTPLVHFKGNVNGSVFQEKVLDKVVVQDVLVLFVETQGVWG